MGAPRKYKTGKALEKKVNEYFDSISRERPLTEKLPTAEKDENGHTVYTEVLITNRLGQPMTVTEYLIPPTVDGLCQFLNIHRSTWWDYCNPKLHPEFIDTTTRARGRMRAWREEQLLCRKDVKGIIFDLENNYYKPEARRISSGAESVPMEKREQQLKEMLEEFEHGQNN